MSILVLTSDTLIGTPATGNLEYNGQFYGTDSNASRAQMQRITQGTAVNSTSGTSIDFTGLPAWCKRITVMFQGVSTNGTSPVCALVGTSSGIVSTGYSAGGMRSFVSANDSVGVQTVRFLVDAAGQDSGASRHGHMVLTNLSGNVWVQSSITSRSDGNASSNCGGSITLSGTLDRVRITTVNGTDTFDAGSINLLLEG